MFSSPSRLAGATLLICLLALIGATRVLAATASASLFGTVLNGTAPVPGVVVTAKGNNLTRTTTTDAKGQFAFPPLAAGTYTVSTQRGSLQANAIIDLGDNGATVVLQLAASNIGRVVASPQQIPAAVIAGSGSDVVLNTTQLTQSPFNNSFAEMEIQMPGAARGANGVVHMNGDHGVIDYILDGVALPQELNRDLGGEINLDDLSFVNLIEGAYPAQYGLKFGSVFNMATRAGTGPAGFDGYGTFGSYTDLQGTIGYHAPLPGGGGFEIALNGMQTTRGLDPPNFGSPHNDAASVGQFARFTLPNGPTDFTDITFINSSSSYQIPNDVDNGEPASTDDNESQADTFLSAQYHHSFNENASLSFGPAYKRSRIQDYGDPSNDFAYGEALNVEAPPYGNGGTSTDCADAIANPATYLPTTCAYSLADTRTAIDYIFQMDYSLHTGPHTIGAGITYDATRVLKDYAITLQPGNFLAPVVTPATPYAATTVVDTSPNIGNTYQSYVQDSWRINPNWQADYGIRYDFFTLDSTQFDSGFGAFSPRFKITRLWGTRASVYAYLGRFFEPFSFENVSPEAAYQLNLPLQAKAAQFDLQPERDTQLELGGHLPLGRGDLGFRVWQKNANNLIDDTQVGVTLLHQDINYSLGRLSQEALNYVQPLTQNGRFYLSAAHTVSLDSGCETQLLAPCFGQPTGYTPADHEQRYSIASGVLLNDKHGGWISADGEYGSGLSSSLNPTGGITCAGPNATENIGGPCKRTAHTTFDLEKGIALSPVTALTLDIQNIFNDRYFVTYLNAQGNHYAPPREFVIGVRVKPPQH